VTQTISRTPRPGSAPVVQTTHGAVRGSLEDGIAVFRGIPYAEPPVGALRFRPPVPRQPWEGEWDATRFGDTVHQLYVFDSDAQVGAAAHPAGDDCLNLNVWTPAPGRTGLPVMVWIHGGAFKTGAGSDPYANGATFARDGVVTVTINYRLHALGYLHLGDRPGSGCFGLLDQVAALEWVRDNIAAFGGDPGNVTVAGESAGAHSVGTLLGMPSARHLFRRGILQSGGIQASIGADGAAIVTNEFLAELGIRGRNLEALGGFSTERLVAAAGAVAQRSPALLAERGIRPDPFGVPLSGGYFPFFPVRGTDVLPDRPLESVLTGAARDVDLLIGTNAEEGRAFRVWMGDGVASAAASQATTETVFALSGRDGSQVYEAYRRLRPGATDEEVGAAILTDVMFRLPAIRLAEAAQQHNPRTFMYRLAYRSAVPGFGAGHALDLPFVWDVVDDPLARAMIGSDPPGSLASAMHGAWVQFIKTGTPGHPVLPEWPAYDLTRRATMQFDATSQVVDDPDGDERRLWDGVRVD
jgi:para-nitrobenzyl esterase